MIAPRCLVPLLCLLAAGTLAASAPAPSDQTSAPPAPVFADERTSRLAGRYETMLNANPSEGLALDRLWKLYDDAGATGRLIDEYHRASDAATADAAPSLVYGHLLKKAGRLDDAAAAYARAAILDAAGPLPPLARAELALTRSRPAEAAALFETALDRLPANDHRRAEILLKTGDAWQSAGQPFKAAEDWEKTVALAPDDLSMHRRLAGNYEKNGLTGQAIGHYEFIEAHADPAGRAGAARELGRLHEARGEFDAARDALERGLALTARDNWLYGDLQTRLIRLYQRAGRAPELEAHWRAAVEQAPRDLGGYLRLELLAQAQGDAAGERAWLEKVVALSPRDHDSALKLARLLAGDGESEPAAALYDKLLAVQPDNLDLILARADLDVQMGRPGAAAARVEARLAQNPADESVVTPALEFFLSHHLDDASEKCLRAQAAREPGATEPSLALAKFLFAQRRAGEARRVLDALTAQPGDADARAARWSAVADVYKEQNLPADALHGWQQAAALQPRAPAPLLAESDLLLAHGDASGAADPLERALGIMPAGPEEVEVEHKLFQVLQAAAPVSDAKAAEETGFSGVISGRPGLSGPVEMTLSGARAGGHPSHASEPLGRYLTDLGKLADAQPTTDHSLRLARWLSWADETDDAVGAAERAIQLDPANVTARDLLVSLHTAAHHDEQAELRLREITALDPSRRADCLRQIAALEAQDNDLEGALKIYDGLQKDAPGSVEALSDLAQAQQRAERWDEALGTWERAYALPSLTPAQRADLRSPLVAAYERLDRFPRAAEVLQAAVDAQSDLSARQDMFRELAAFCRKHDLVDWLTRQYQARLAAQPTDYFTLSALADLSKDAGRDREAYQLLERAFYSSPDPTGSLRALADAAEALGENDEAISLQRRLTLLPGQATAENLEKLADLQTANLDPEAAEHTWESIAARFPRDPGSLERAAEFFENDGKVGRARELLRQVVALDANHPGQLLHLSRLDAAAGDAAGARDLLEQLLVRTEPEKSGDPLIPPPELDDATAGLPGVIMGLGGRRVHSASLLPAPKPAPEGDEHHLRLDAIRDLARVLNPGGSDADREKWLDRWNVAAATGARGEPLAAFYYAGQNRRVMDLVTGWLAARPDDDRLRNTFLAAGLRLGEYRTLAEWVWRDDGSTPRSERGQWLLGALEQFFNAGGKPAPNMVADLFPPNVKMRDLLWEIASGAFADRHWYTQAAELGTRVYAMTPSNRSEYALKLAQWELYVGNAGHARAVLRDAAEADRGGSFEPGINAVFTALRAYFLLLPENERAAFAEDYPRRMRDDGETVHAALSAVLLHGLMGDERAAERNLDDLLGLRLLSTVSGGGTPDARRWGYILNNGTQLQAWNLDGLAAYYWRRALREVSAFERQDGDVMNFQAEIRGRLLGVEVAMAPDPQAARERVDEYLRPGLRADLVTVAAAQIMAASQFPAAARIYEALCRTRSNEAENWRELFIAYESAGDQAALERSLTGLLAGSGPLPNGLTRVELVARLANQRQAEGDRAGACRLLEHAHQSLPGALPLVLQLAPMEEAAGRWEDAAQLWSEAVPLDPSGGARLSLAKAKERLGQTGEAVTILDDLVRSAAEPIRTNAAVQMASLYVSAHRLDDARALGTRLLQDGPTDALPRVAEILAAAKQQPFTRELLATAVRRTHDPRLRFNEQQELVSEDASPGDDPAVFAREMHRLESFARADAGMHNAFVRVRYDLARQRKAEAWLETELKREWDGSKGDLEAGENLADLYFATNRDDGLRDVVSAINNHPDLPEQMLHSLEERLVQTRHGALALPLLERLRRRFPQNEGYLQDQARALWQAGRPEEARAALEAFDARSAFEDDLVGQAGVTYLELGDKASARQEFEAVVRHDGPVVHHPQIAVSLARLDLEDHRLPEAHRLLRLAYRNPICTDLTPIVDYLAASGQLAGDSAHRALPGGDFPLTFPRRAQLLTAICDRLTADGRPGDARGWVEAHPELLAGAPGLVSTMSRDMAPTELPGWVALVENAVSQTDPPVPRLKRELAALCVRWAEQDNDPASALDHLVRAHELDPDNFDDAQRLAAACLAQKQDDRAAAALAAFLGPDALSQDRARAEQTLGLLPAKTVPKARES